MGVLMRDNVNFDVYSPRDLNVLSSILMQYPPNTSIQVVLADMAHSQLKQRLKARLEIPGDLKRGGVKPVVKSFAKCPECGSIMLEVKNDEGLKILGCRKCRYSEVV